MKLVEVVESESGTVQGNVALVVDSKAVLPDA
jgi:hypothetical protein